MNEVDVVRCVDCEQRHWEIKERARKADRYRVATRNASLVLMPIYTGMLLASIVPPLYALWSVQVHLGVCLGYCVIITILAWIAALQQPKAPECKRCGNALREALEALS